MQHATLLAPHAASSLERALEAELARRARRALVEFVAARPEVTLEELAELVARTPELGGMTLSELFGALQVRRAEVIAARVVLTEPELERLDALLTGKVRHPPGLARTLASLDGEREPPRIRWKGPRVA